MELAVELARIAAALREAGIEYALCGGLAVAVHGAPRATKDIDLLVEEVSLASVLAAVQPLGFLHRAGKPMRFPDGMRIQRVSRVEGSELLTLDLLLVDENTLPAWRSRRSYVFLSGEISVVSREELIGMKAMAGRPQDLADIERLRGDDR